MHNFKCSRNRQKSAVAWIIDILQVSDFLLLLTSDHWTQLSTESTSVFTGSSRCMLLIYKNTEITSQDWANSTFFPRTVSIVIFQDLEETFFDKHKNYETKNTFTKNVSRWMTTFNETKPFINYSVRNTGLKRKEKITQNHKFLLKIETFMALLCFFVFFSRYPSGIYVHLFRAFFPNFKSTFQSFFLKCSRIYSLSSQS